MTKLNLVLLPSSFTLLIYQFPSKAISEFKKDQKVVDSMGQ